MNPYDVTFASRAGAHLQALDALATVEMSEALTLYGPEAVALWRQLVSLLGETPAARVADKMGALADGPALRIIERTCKRLGEDPSYGEALARQAAWWEIEAGDGDAEKFGDCAEDESRR